MGTGPNEREDEEAALSVLTCTYKRNTESLLLTELKNYLASYLKQ
jgi:hypothetical protein